MLMLALYVLKGNSNILQCWKHCFATRASPVEAVRFTLLQTLIEVHTNLSTTQTIVQFASCTFTVSPKILCIVYTLGLLDENNTLIRLKLGCTLLCNMYSLRSWGGAVMLGKLAVAGRTANLDKSWQGPTMLAVGAGGVDWTFYFSLLSPFSPIYRSRKFVNFGLMVYLYPTDRLKC